MVFSWFLFALLSPIFYSISSVRDKWLMVEHVSVARYMRIMGVVNLAIGVILAFFVPFPQMPQATILLIPGILWAGVYYFYLKALEREEVSRVIGIIYVFPVFVALAAAMFLGEKLPFISYLAILLVVFGVLLIATRRIGDTLKTTTALPWLIGCIAFEVAVEVLDKYFLNSYSPFEFLILSQTGIFLGCVPFFFRRSMPLRRESGVVISQMFIVGANFTFILAAALTEVSKVAAAISIQPGLTFLAALVLSQCRRSLLDETIDKKNLFRKTWGIVLIVLGILFLR